MTAASSPAPVKASLAIAAQFRAMIARGELSEGQPLPVESDLMDELGVSKGIVREALRILETEGLVEVRRGLGGGPRVRHPSISDAAKAIGVYLQIGDVPVRDVWETRDRIIGAAVERLARRGDADAIAPFALRVAALHEEIGNVEEYYLQMLDVEESAVLAAGSTTEHVMVVSLRHIIAAELEEASRSVVDRTEAVAAEDMVANAWADALRHIRAGRPLAARRAYDRQALAVWSPLLAHIGDATVGEVVNQTVLAARALRGSRAS